MMLLRSARIAVGPSLLLLATIGAIASSAGWNLADRVCLTDAGRRDQHVARLSLMLQRWPSDRNEPMVDIWSTLPSELGTPPFDPITTMPIEFIGPLTGILNPNLSWRCWLYFGLGWGWTLLVWSLFGCAITRMAALRFTWDRSLGIPPALQFARFKLGTHLGTVLTPIVGVITVGIPVILLGLLMRTSLGAALGGLFWGVVLAVSIFTAIIALGLILGWPLIWGALAAEDSDAFDAMSRSYSYVFQGGVRYLGYLLLAAGVGLVGWLLVWFFSELVIALGQWTAALGMGADRLSQLIVAANDASGALDRFAAFAIFLWEAVLRSFASGYAYSYFWTAFAGIYLLLRRDVDSTPLDTISEEEERPADSNG